MLSPMVRRVLHGQLVAKQSLTLAWPQIAAHPWVSRCSSEHAAVNRITLHEFNPNAKMSSQGQMHLLIQGLGGAHTSVDSVRPNCMIKLYSSVLLYNSGHIYNI